jgi:hypothetical protein
LLDETAFTDALSRNLKRGRCLLLIVGDGISENVEAMAEFLQQHAGMQFALALVQLAVYDVPGSSQRLVVPSIPLRTTNIVRGIVQFNSEAGVTVSPPKSFPAEARGTSLSEDQFFQGLDLLRKGTSERLLAFLDQLQEFGVSYEVKKTLIIRMVVGGNKVLPLVVNQNGSADTGYTPRKDLMRGYAESLASTVPGAVLKETASSWYVGKRKTDGSILTVWDLLDRAEDCMAAFKVLNDTLKKRELNSDE